MLKLLALIGLLGIVGAIAVAAFFFGGFYSVAATAEDPGIVTWALVHVREASIARHAAKEVQPVSVDNDDMTKAGARAYATRGCTGCHGGPGVEWQKFSEGLHPDPPDLKDVVNGLEPRELFWVVKNGINMTGMPGFGPVGVDDKEIWNIVAFLKKLPAVSDDDYKAWTAGAVTP
jgi:hypothetical protein